MRESDGCYETHRSSPIKMTGWFFCPIHSENTFSKESSGRHSTRGFIPTKGGGTRLEKKALNPCAGNHIITEALLGDKQYQCCKTLIMERFSILKIVCFVLDFTLFESLAGCVVVINDQIILWKQKCSILMSHLSCRRASTTYSDWGPAGSRVSACGPSVPQSWWRAICTSGSVSPQDWPFSSLWSLVFFQWLLFYRTSLICLRKLRPG